MPKPGLRWTLRHGQAFALTVVAFFFISTAGVVSRHLHTQAPFEITFWRSAFAAMALVLTWLAFRAIQWVPPAPWRSLVLWASALCWAVMFTAFMVALMLTSVANALITLALGPLITALVSSLVLRHRLRWHTWGAMVLAGLGVTWMFGQAVHLQDQQALVGMAVALAVPVAAAIQWNVLHQSHHANVGPIPLVPSVMIGATLSAVFTLPMAWPLQASVPDIAALALLGMFQLALPCAVLVWVARVLSPTELGLLALLELIFGIGLTWLGAGEAPTVHAWVGGSLVLIALLLQQLGAAPTQGAAQTLRP
jgi:drug/metabolite transporter (DMT)-like permease